MAEPDGAEAVDMAEGSPKSRHDELMDSGMEAINERRFDDALAVAQDLYELRYSGAFEIEALALNGLGNTIKAVEVLRRGVAVAPDVWLNWQLLGNYLSDLGEYDEAAKAYESALGCPGVEMAWIKLNQATLANRREDFPKALAMLDGIDEPALLTKVAFVRASALRGMGRGDEAIDGALATLDRLEAARIEDDPNAFQWLVRVIGDLMLDQGEPPEEVRGFLKGSAYGFGRAPQVLGLIRKIDGKGGETASMFRLLLECREGLDEESSSYFISVDVFAENEEEAIEFVKALEQTDRPWNCRVDNVARLEQQGLELKGVYAMTRRQYFQE